MIEIQIGTKRSTKLDAIHLLMSLSKPNYSIIIEKNFIFMELLRRCSLHYMIYPKLTPALTIDAIKKMDFMMILLFLRHLKKRIHLFLRR